MVFLNPQHLTDTGCNECKRINYFIKLAII